MTKPLADQTPAEIDTALAALYEEVMKFRTWIAGSENVAERYLSGLRNAQSENARARIERLAAEATEQANAYRKQLDELWTSIAPFNREFDRRGGWNRYFLVLNSNGHVHRERNCTTCYPDTRYAWLPELSDCVEGDMIVEFGEKACTVCFPNAPTNPAFHAPGRRDAEAIAARQAEKAAKAAAKAAKAIGPFRVPSCLWQIETVAAAKQELREVVASLLTADYDLNRRLGWSTRPEAEERALRDENVRKDTESLNILLAALLEKGIELAEINTIIERAEKKARREIA
jgi:hypothetical protein